MDIEGFGKAFKIIFIPTIPLQNKEKKVHKLFEGIVKTTHSCVKYGMEPLKKYKLRLYDAFLTLRCSLAMRHAVFRMKPI